MKFKEIGKDEKGIVTEIAKVLASISGDIDS